MPRPAESSFSGIVLALLALLVAACDSPAPPATETLTATLAIRSGVVEVATGSDFAAGHDGQVLMEGDRVRTGRDGRASIHYFDGSVTQLDHDTTFTIGRLEVLDLSTGARVIESDQSSGNTFHRVVNILEPGSRFDVATPVAATTVRGTDYAIVSGDDGSITVAVLTGVVTVSSPVVEFDVGDGFALSVAADGTADPPVPIPIGLLNSDWLQVNLCEAGDDRCDDEPPPPPPGADGFVPPGAVLSASLMADLDGDGVDEMILQTTEPDDFCGDAETAELGLGRSDLYIVAYDRTAGAWQVVYELTEPLADGQPGFEENVGSARLSTADFDPGPGTQVVWEHTALGGCGNNPETDLYVIAWDGVEGSVALNVGFGGTVRIVDQSLVVVQSIWEGLDPTFFPSSCVVTVYTWSNGGMMVADEVGPITCEVAYEYDPSVGIDGEVVLAGNGLGVAFFGANPDATITTLTAIIGPPIDDTGWLQVDPFDTSQPGDCSTRTVDLDGLTVYFGLEEDGSSLGFVGWATDDARWRTDEGLGVGSTVAEFEDGSLFETFGVYVLSAGGMTFSLDDGFAPDGGSTVIAARAGFAPCLLE